MWAWTPEAAQLLSGGHEAVSRVDVWQAGSPVYTLEVVSGSVGIDADRPVRSNLSATLIDSTGALTRGDVDDLLNPYDCEIAPWRGVRVYSTEIGYGLTGNAGFGLQPFGTSGFGGGEQTLLATRTSRDEFAPLGVFGLTSRQVSDGPDGLTISLAGQDRAMAYQVPMTSALAIPGATPVEDAIVRLLARVNPAINVQAMVTGFTTGPLLYDPDTDVWNAAQELAQSVGARLFHNRIGQCVMAPIGPPSRMPVLDYTEGDGLLLSLDRTEDSDTVRNVVVAESPDGLVRATAYDDDTSSPTFAGGRYGWRPAETMKNQHFQSLKQAQQAAQARLVYELGRSETVAFNAVPNPGLDVDDVVTVNRPRAGLVERALAVATLTVPLGAEDEMQVGCRKSVLAQDGRILPEAA